MTEAVTIAEAARRLGKSATSTRKMIERHGVKKSADGKYPLDDLLKAHLVGKTYDKNKAKKDAGVSDESAVMSSLDESLVTGTKKAKLKKLMLEIKKIEMEIEEISGRLISLDKHKADILAVQSLMMVWWQQAIEKVSTVRKDAGLLAELNEARDKASQEILEAL